MQRYIVHATVYKYDEGLEAETKANVNHVFEAENKNKAKEKAIQKFMEDYQHPKISKIEVKIDKIDLINEI